MENPEASSKQALPPPRPGRIWAIAMSAAVLAALAAWAVEESSLTYYRPKMTAKASEVPRDYRPDLRAKAAGEGTLGAPAMGGGAPMGGAPMGGPPPGTTGPGGAAMGGRGGPGAGAPGGGMPGGAATGGGAPGGRGGPGGGRGGSPYGAARAWRAYQEEHTAKAVALSGGAVGAMFGLAIGLAIGLSGGRSRKSWIVGIVASVIGASVCGVAGWYATQALVPIFYRARADNPGSALVTASLLLIRGIPRMIAGFAGGLALGVAAGGGSNRLIRGAVGGMVGAALGVVLMVIGDEVFALLASQQEIATSPILRSPLHRVAAILAVTVPSAVFAAWTILGVKNRPDASPAIVPEIA